MGLQKLILWLGPLLFLLGAARFLHVADKRQRVPVLLAWLVPGLGHWVIGERKRAVFFAVQIIGLFAAGLILSDFRCVSPFDRHPIWGLTQIPGGALTAITALATRSLFIEHDSPLYPVGCLYVGVACLLNLVAICDVYDLTEPQSRRAARGQPA